MVKLNSSSELVREPEAKDIAEAFIPWFYDILNSLNSNNNSYWTHTHFWNDAKLILHIQQPNGTHRDEIQGSTEASNRLIRFMLNFQVMFSPNLTANGVQSEMNCHGLLFVKSAGTLHKDSIAVGLYEQIFGLIKDPMSDGNWKIKDTQLQIRLKTANQNAVLCG